MTALEFKSLFPNATSSTIARNCEAFADAMSAHDPVDNEGELHKAILKECAQHGWIAFHGSMAHKTFRTPGEPDYIILLSNHRAMLVECKSRTGKLSPDQRAIKAWAHKLEWEVHVVRSIEEFREKVELT